MRFGLFDGGGDVEHSGVGLVGIAIQDDVLYGVFKGMLDLIQSVSPNMAFILK